MNRRFVAAALLSAAALLPYAAAAQSDFGRWSVEYDDSADICYMRQDFEPGSGVTTSLSVDMPWDAAPLLVMRNNTWTMEEADTSAEIWFSGDWERAADAAASARFHKAEGATHVDVTLSDDLLGRMGATGTIIVRVSGGPFERYEIGPTSAAVADLFDCYDTMY
jgi:hypothetical protein